MSEAPIRLTTYSHGSGCGCKIAPAVLEEIMKELPPLAPSAKVLVGHQTRDDAAVYDLGHGQALISTTDFFTPIVDDPFDFGYIAAANALSDIYAMGGRPVLALAILGWPVEQLSPDIAATVLKGGQAACETAQVPLAGGHSIDSPEPFFGLAVNGLVSTTQLKTNSGAQVGDRLYLTKPLGTGIVSTAQKRGQAKQADVALITAQMKQLNTIGLELAQHEGVHAMTDVTGFGLLGHLIELCEAAQLSASLDVARIPSLDQAILEPYLEAYTIPDNTYRNFNGYGHKASTMTAQQIHLLCDPQTNGGLLLAVAPAAAETIEALVRERGLPHSNWGVITEQQEKVVLL